MWSSLKQLIRENNDRCIIVEDGEPRYVLVSYEEYQQLQKGGNDSIVRENLEDLNEEIQDITNVGKVDTPSVRIEDLPF